MTDQRVQLDTHWHYHGFRALVIENSCLRLVILPELGAKLWSLVYKPADRERPTTVYDVHATILHLLGIDHERLTVRHNGIDRRLTDVHGHVIREILA